MRWAVLWSRSRSRSRNRSRSRLDRLHNTGCKNRTFQTQCFRSVPGICFISTDPDSALNLNSDQALKKKKKKTESVFRMRIQYYLKTDPETKYWL